ncbi:hypothetical protein ACFFRR_009161 [Megaselia abdita]
MLKSYVLGIILVTFFLTCHHALGDVNLIYEADKTSIIVKLDSESPYRITETSCVGSDERSTNCSGLQPCMGYNVTTYLSLKDDDSNLETETTTGVTEIVEHSKDLIYTKYDTPFYWIESITTKEEELNIKWDAENKYCISRLIYEVKNEVTSIINNNVEIKLNPIVVTGLHPCQSYTVNLTAIDSNSEEVECKEEKECLQQADMKYKHPESLSNVSIANETDAILKLTWTNPTDVSCVKNYTIFHKIVGSIDWVTEEIKDQIATEYLLYGLYGCENYLVDVLLNIDLKNFDESLLDTALEFQAPVIVPNDPLVLSLGDQEVSADKTITVSLHWEQPKNHSKCVKFYIVEITSLEDDETKTIELDSTETSIEFVNLYPCSGYDFLVTPHTENDTGVGARFNTILKEVQPDQVENIQYTPLPHTFNLTWETPRITKNCIVQYRITGWATNDPTNNEYKFGESTKDTTFLARNLISCQAYTIQIIPEGPSKADGKPYQVQLEAMPTKEEAVALESKISTHSIELIVKSTDQTTLCPVLFVKFSCIAAFQDNDIPHKGAEVIQQALKTALWSGTVQPLSPYTEYLCQGSIFNSGGWANSVERKLTTAFYFPSEPRNVTANYFLPNSLNYTWDIPRYPNGIISIYNMVFKDLGPAYFRPEGCPDTSEPDRNIQQDARSRSFTSLKPFNKYSFQVCASNSMIGEYSDVLITSTAPDVPSPAEGIRIIVFDPDNNATEYSAKVEVSWNIPCDSNGEIKMFDVRFSGKRKGNVSALPHEFKRLVCPDGSIPESEVCDHEKPRENGKISIVESNLYPDYNYTVAIQILNYQVDQPSVTRLEEFTSKAGLPETPEFKIKEITKTDVPSSTATVVLEVENLNDQNGLIERSALLVSQIGCDDEEVINRKDTDYISDDNPYPKPLSWSDVAHADCVQQYQTTNEEWNIVGVDGRDGSSDQKLVQYTIGTDKCAIDKEEYCNGPLKPSTYYNVTLRIFTRNSYRDIHVKDFSTESLIRLYVIVFSILGCLLVAFFGGFMYLWITKQQIWRKDSINHEDQTGDISLKNFELHYYHISNRDKLQREFKELQVVAVDLSVTASRLNENRNRYSNIFPYDKNRVILDIDTDGSDYINASFINGYRRRKEYIATQGPKLDTAIDFWRMVLQHNVKVIAMVTQIKEGDIIKCHRYFPMGQMKYMKFGNHITVMLTSETSDDMLERREFSVKHSGDGYSRNVVHYYFKKWPDHDCPADPEDLINFIKKIKSEKKSSHSPIVVHCRWVFFKFYLLIINKYFFQRWCWQNRHFDRP